MKLDEIQDIEVLRKALKEKMAKCIKSFTIDEVEFKEGEYYFFEFDYEEQWYYIEYEINKNKLVYEDDIKKYFELPKEGEA